MYLRLAGKVLKRKLNVTSLPSFVTFFVTWRCNCRCIMCDIWKKKGYDDELTRAQIATIFSQLRLDVLRISGGEPFLREDIADIINVIGRKSRPGVVHVTTNGLLTDRIADAVTQVAEPRKLHIKVSIDSLGAEHDRIRGVSAFDKAMQTVERLAELRGKRGFFLGVNQTIVDNSGLKAYPELRDRLAEMDVDLLPVIAYDASTSLYSDTDAGSDPAFRSFGNLGEDELREFMAQLKKDTENVADLKEKLLKRYQLLGMQNWLLKGEDKPNPACVALHDHMRLLPNGDVPVCMYNRAVVGNLKSTPVNELWFGADIAPCRAWVRDCKGCRAGCEVNVSAIYTGDLIRALF